MGTKMNCRLRPFLTISRLAQAGRGMEYLWKHQI